MPIIAGVIVVGPITGVVFGAMACGVFVAMGGVVGVVAVLMEVKLRSVLFSVPS